MKFNIFSFVIIICFTISCSDDPFLDGFDTAALFASPTQAELDAISSEWRARDLSPKDYKVEQTTDVGNGTKLKIVSFHVSGYKEYGMLLVPAGDDSLPVRMYFGGFGKDVTENSVILQMGNEAAANPFVFAIPAFRGQPLKLTINGTSYTTPLSEGEHCDAFEGAADDAIAFLNVINVIEDKVDVERTSVRGGSRGGTVSLLMAERDRRVKIAICVAGPANMLELTSTHENDPTYQCQFLDGLVNKNTTVADARKKMIASSPIFFAKDLPRTQMHLGEEDVIVPVSQGDELKEKVKQVGSRGTFDLFIYDGRGHDDIANGNTELNTRIETLLNDL
ncbi:MAG TPA: prolyl oligopeptidase family serine peptidase [Cyclobacteriaceae bacterium]|nr:prolyl oligopeptidase family serine peptidase [Cyclobacteriaceae bacterium]